VADRRSFLSSLVSTTGISVVVHALAFVRQMLIAAWFGVTRELDIYVVLFALATSVVFTLASIFDSVAVPALVRKRDSDGAEAMHSFAALILRLSILIGIAASALLLIVTPLLTPIVASGFSIAERAKLMQLAWYFLPWTFICVPYYAVAARYKAEWRFVRVFCAEIVVVVVSIGSLTIWHADISSLPLAYGAGYFAGFLWLNGAQALWGYRVGAASDGTGLLRNIGVLYLANQSGSLAGLADRHFQSLVPAGGIAAINYSNQLVSALSTLLAFREIFVVPLSERNLRAEKLERLIIGLVLLTVPIAGIVICFAPEMVAILFQHGRFDAAATELTGEVLRINALGIVTATVALPMFRMFQVLDRNRLAYVVYLSSAAALTVLGYIFIAILKWGAPGIAVMNLGASIIVCGLTAWLVALCGVRLRWRRIAKYLGYAALVSLIAALASLAAASGAQYSWYRVIIGSIGYAVVVAGAYLLVKPQLSAVVGLERRVA